MIKKIWQPLALLVAVLLVWEFGTIVFKVAPYILPAPTAVLEALWVDRDYFLENTPTTLIEITVGFAIGLLVGILLAIPVALTHFGRNAVMPLLVATQSIPKVALAPLFVIWFGFGLEPKILIVALLVFFPVVVNMAQGLQSVESELVQYMRTLGARPLKIFFLLRLQNSLPALFSGIKVAVPTGTIGAIVGEFINANAGIGYVILRSIGQFDTETTFAGILIVSAIGVMLYGLVAGIERRALAWHFAASAQAN